MKPPSRVVPIKPPSRGHVPSALHAVPPENEWICDLYAARSRKAADVLRVTNAVIKKLPWQRGLVCVEKMRSVGVEPNIFIYCTLIAACGKDGLADMALQLFKQMLDKGIKPDVSVFSALITACANGWLTKEALDLFRQMKDDWRIPPDVRTFGAVITACAKGGLTKEALDLFRQMKDDWGIPPNVFIFSALITACANDGRPYEALKLFRQMKADWNIVPDVVIINALIAACANGALPNKALELLEFGWKIGVYQEALGYDPHSNTLDFHLDKVSASPTGDARIGCVSLPVARTLFAYHSREGNISVNTAFVVGQHGVDATKDAVKQCIRERGWTPTEDRTNAGVLLSVSASNKPEVTQVAAPDAQFKPPQPNPNALDPLIAALSNLALELRRKRQSSH